jgi:chloramphenicol 3-O-phosphotransferase
MRQPSAREVGQIVVVNGTSGSGKSTACELFVKRRPDFWLRYGIDDFLRSTFPPQFGHHGPLSERGFRARPLDEDDPDGTLRWEFGAEGWAAFRTFHEWIAAASRQGCNIVVDHLLLTDPDVLTDLAQRLDGLPALLVTLKPDYDVLMQRIESRVVGNAQPAAKMHGEDGIRIGRERLNRLRPWFYESIYANGVCDLLVDTVANPPERVCDLIEARLAAGPGEAFATLRASGIRASTTDEGPASSR